MRWDVPRAARLTRAASRQRLAFLAGDHRSGGSRLLGSPAGRWVPVALAAALAGLSAALPAGPVAGTAAAFYAAVLMRAVLRRLADRAARSARTAAIDAVGTLAADLRAGVAPARALSEALPALRGDRDPAVVRAAERVVTAWTVADQLGTALADLLERVEADLRAADQVQIRVAAETAGVRLTAGLLAVLPVVGILLGYGWGVDPLDLLLHTRYGAGCALGALLLQGLGMAWTGRMCRDVSTGAA